MINIPEIELAWMAGFFDGEGSIRVSYSLSKYGTFCFSRRACVVNTRRDILEIFQKYFGGTIRENFHMVKFNKNAKPTFVWVVAAKQSAYFIGMLYPHLKLKAEHADLFLDYNSLVGEKFKKHTKQNLETRFCIVNRLKQLNHRGLECHSASL